MAGEWVQGSCYDEMRRLWGVVRNHNAVLTILTPAISGVFAVADWIAVRRKWREAEWVCKPLVMVGLIVVALRLHPSPLVGTGPRGWFVAALALSLAGDVFLMLGSSDRLFAAGLGSFLLAHLAYIAGFVGIGLSAARLLGAALVLAVLGGLVGREVLMGVGRRAPALRGPVLAYMAAISVMVACAAGSGRWLGLLGALLFYVSDAAIAWNRFVEPFDSAKVLIIVTYHLAQFLLVASLVW